VLDYRANAAQCRRALLFLRLSRRAPPIKQRRDEKDGTRVRLQAISARFLLTTLFPRFVAFVAASTPLPSFLGKKRLDGGECCSYPNTFGIRSNESIIDDGVFPSQRRRISHLDNAYIFIPLSPASR
jgi:hypothetical protein